ncbi:MAG: tetratricopeptide repeat protein [Pyrinomonadaceae bacterium]
MSNISTTKTANVSGNENTAAFLPEKTLSIRVSPNNYFIALFLAAFFSALLFYLQYDFWGILLFGLSFLTVPYLLWSDRITFDGKRITRTGILPKFWASLNNSRYRLKIGDIEQVETHALRALKRGGNVFYRYRTSIKGKGLEFVFASGGEEYRRMIHAVLPMLWESILDSRSIELRDYFAEPKETLMKAEFARIPSAEVLENSFGKHLLKNQKNDSSLEEEIKAEDLRVLANELRLSGYLLQALEAFRRALVLNPKDGWILFEFARCLHSFASSEKDQKLKKKAFAALRLAEKRSGNDGELLSRLGETYFQFGDLRRARLNFQKAIDTIEENFRSVRGLAEVALREGKIAHVIHHFASANRLAETPALRRWTRDETDYFSRLNNDEDYMDLEISRVNMLETLEKSKVTTLKIALFAFPAILIGVVGEDNLIANLGWAVSTIALFVWVGLIITRNMLAERIPLDLIEEEE